LHRFADEAAAAGADGVLVTDLIVEEAGEYLTEMARVGLAPIFLAAPTSPDERLEAIATNSKGFIYAISRVGITGTQQSLAADAAALVARIKRWSTLPVAVGFGISNAGHVAQVAEFADAAVIGSAIVELIERSTPETAADEVARFIKDLNLPAAVAGAGPVNKAPLVAAHSA
jgi:tryptophan synthase alpha chain